MSNTNKTQLDILWDDILCRFHNKKNAWYNDIEIKRDDPAIVIEGPKDKLIFIINQIFHGEHSIYSEGFSLDVFEIAMDFGQGYISFFLKPENHA